MKRKDNPVVRAVERAELPYLLFPDDVALRFRVEPEEARQAIRAGLLGPWCLINGEPVVLRDQMKEHLRLRMAQRREVDKEVFPREASTELRLVDDPGQVNPEETP